MGQFNFILYTHTDVADVWPIFFGQQKKYFPDAEKIVFVNKEDSRIPSEYHRVFYDDKLTYRERVLSCMNQVNVGHWLIYQHEDMFLYDTPDYERMIKYMSNTEAISHWTNVGNSRFIKLIRGGEAVGKPNRVFPELKIVRPDFDYIFAIQPSIWSSEHFKEVFQYGKGNTIWEFEIDAQRVCRERNIMGHYVDDGGIKRGRYHWDSNVFPYIATAVVKGRWNLREYKKELGNLLKEYNIDYKQRGSNE